MGTTADKLAYLEETKTDIKNAIVTKGVEVPDGTTFRQYANLISGISTGLSDEDLAKATATPGDVTAGKTFYAGNREMKTGTASKGLVLYQKYTGNIPSGGNATFNIQAENISMHGTYWCNGASGLNVSYNRDTIIDRFYNSRVIKLSVSYSNGMYTVVLTNSSNYVLYFSSDDSGESPLFIYVG